MVIDWSLLGSGPKKVLWTGSNRLIKIIPKIMIWVTLDSDVEAVGLLGNCLV